jgi:membrane protein YqaA with SNARE-associated domain
MAYVPLAAPALPPLAVARHIRIRATWGWPGIMIILAALSLGGAVTDPARKWLWFYLPYSFVGNSLAPLPFDGYVIALGQDYAIWLVVLVGVIGTVIVEAWNMELLGRLLAQDSAAGFRNHALTRWALKAYGRAPFLTLVGTCVLPIIPHYPMRVLVSLSRYPMWRYQASVVLGRGGRYAWLALIGWSIPVPGEWIAVASLGLLLLGIRGARRMNTDGIAKAEGGAA